MFLDPSPMCSLFALVKFEVSPDIYYISLPFILGLPVHSFPKFSHSSLASTLSTSWSPTEMKFDCPSPLLCAFQIPFVVVPSQHASFQNCSHAVWSFHAVPEWNIEHSKSFSVESFLHAERRIIYSNHICLANTSEKTEKLNWNLLSVHSDDDDHEITHVSFWLHSLQWLTRGFGDNLFIISGLILNYPAQSTQQRSQRDTERQ